MSLSRSIVVSLVCVVAGGCMHARAGSSPRVVGWRTLEVRDDARRLRPGHDGPPVHAVRTLDVQLWYPASGGGTPVTYVDYARGDRAKLESELAHLDLPAAVATRLPDLPRAARANASPADGSFPLAVWVGGSPRVVAPMAEELASRGWVVAGFTDIGRQAEIDLRANDAETIEHRTRDIEVVVAALAREPGVDARRPALIGFSAAAPSVLLYEARNGAGAVATFDGWEGNLLGRRAAVRIADATPTKLRAPYLAIHSRDGADDRDPRFAAEAVYASRTLVEFPTTHLGLLPVRGAAAAEPTYPPLVALVSAFLDHAVRGGAAPQLPTGARVLAGEAAPIDDVDIARALADRADIPAAMRALQAAALPEDALNELGYRFLRSGKRDAALAILRHATERYPNSANTWDSLGEAQLGAGQRDAAIASYRAALVRNPNFGSSIAALTALGVPPERAAAAVQAPEYRLVLRPPAGEARVTSAELAPGRTIEVHHGPAGGPVLVVLDGVGAPLRTWQGYREWARLLIAAGINVVLYDGATVSDADGALAYVHAHARELALDDSRLCIFASSANARVGVRMPLRPSGAALQCAVFYYPMLDVPVVRPELPTLVVRTGIDTPAMLAAIDAWVATAVAANAQLEVINLPQHHHGFDARDDNDESRRVMQATIAFLVRQLRAPK